MLIEARVAARSTNCVINLEINNLFSNVKVGVKYTCTQNYLNNSCAHFNFCMRVRGAEGAKNNN